MMEFNAFTLKIIAVICMTIVEVVALLKGIDSWILGMYTATVGGIVGYHIKEAVNKAREYLLRK